MTAKRLRRPRKIFPKTRLLPKMAATNAYQLLDEVVAAILAEPKRLDMASWVRSAEHLGSFTSSSRVPACGTVACCAGWVCVLARPRAVVQAARTGENGHISSIAKHLLGVSDAPGGFERALDRLFVAHGANIMDLQWGTRRYALAVVARIRAFQAAWSAHLLATPVTRV